MGSDAIDVVHVAAPMQNRSPFQRPQFPDPPTQTVGIHTVHLNLHVSTLAG